MEVKIGVQFSTRELVVESDETAEALEKRVTEALATGTGVFALSDEKGRRVVVPVEKLAYVEIDPPSGRTVGFGRM